MLYNKYEIFSAEIFTEFSFGQDFVEIYHKYFCKISYKNVWKNFLQIYTTSKKDYYIDSLHWIENFKTNYNRRGDL